jgi:ABC-type nitrate/sulfonate/bicarbonate transport system substrate-binding protein
MPTPLITAGFLPLLDSVLLVLAHELGLDEQEGFKLALTRETSWANIRDRAALGHFNISLMLAPMPIAASLGLTPLATPMIAPVMTGLGNNAVTVSQALWRSMLDAGAPGDLMAGPAGAALREVARDRPGKLRFGVVHQTSSHNYELRYWLAASGIRPDRDIEIVVLPPPLLPEALGSGGIDGYCVGEPWNSVGVVHHGGHIVTTKASIWRHSPDKAIGMRRDWAERYPDRVQAVIRAIYRAGQWCHRPENRPVAAEIMSRHSYLDLPVDIVARALTGMIDDGSGLKNMPEFFVPHDHAANYPWKSHALWYYTQMVRWGEVTPSAAHASAAAATFRPDLYRQALAPLAIEVPVDDFKNEDTTAFFDQAEFDPNRIENYLAAQHPH